MQKKRFFLVGVCLVLILFCFNSFIGNADAQFTIVLDAGHGGSDSGAVSTHNGTTYVEKSLNLTLTKLLQKKLAPYANVLMTRDNDTFVSLSQRAKFANSQNANLFISIHHNWNSSSSATGISTFYSSYRPNMNLDGAYVEDFSTGKTYPVIKEVNGNVYYNDNGVEKYFDISTCDCMAYDPTPTTAAKKSAELAPLLAKSLATLGFVNRGAHDQNLYVTRWTDMPSVLIENGFISNAQEAQRISNPTVENQMAQKITNTIVSFFNLNNKVQIVSTGTDKPSPQLEATPIQLKANAVGGSNQQFQFWARDGSNGPWKMLRDYSSSNTFNWTPQKPGDYKISVHVKNKGSSKAYDDYSSFYYKILNRPVEVKSVETDKSSPQMEDVGIKIIANAIGGVNKQYQFWARNGTNGSWEMIRDYSTSNTYTWTPKKPGKYKISVHVKDIGSTKAYDDYGSLYYNVLYRPVTMENVTVDKGSPQYNGTSIHLTANAIGGKDQLLYQFWVQKDKGSWKMVQDYSASDKYSWTPTQPGNYKFAVHVKDQNSTNEYDDYGVLNYKVLLKPVKMQSITTDLKSPQSANSGIKITANATGGTQRLYQFWAGKDGNWHMLKDYGSSNTYTWIPKEAGDYKIVVHVKDKNSTNQYDDYESMAYRVEQPAQLTGLKADKVSPQTTGSKIKITASGSGGTERLYQFWVRKGNSGSWKMVKDYSTSDTYNWAPTEAGDYKIAVHVKDKNSTKAYDDYKSFYYKINTAPVEVQGVTMDKPSPQVNGTNVRITAVATGGTERLYQFWVRKGNNGSWKMVKDYSTSDTYNWAPTEAGEYKIAVHVKDKNSTKVYDDYKSFYYTIK